MKILLIGASGTLGSKIRKRLEDDNEIIGVGRSSGDIQADITDPASINSLFRKAVNLDAVIVTAGSAPMKPLDEMENDDFMEGIKSKMMGQINVALTAMEYLNEAGSVTLTSGILAEDPIPNGTILSTVNNAVNGFVIGSYGEFLQKNLRINVVSPALVEDSADELQDYFPGHTPAKMNEVVDGYEKTLKTLITGQIIRIG